METRIIFQQREINNHIIALPKTSQPDVGWPYRICCMLGLEPKPPPSTGKCYPITPQYMCICKYTSCSPTQRLLKCCSTIGLLIQWAGCGGGGIRTHRHWINSPPLYAARATPPIARNALKNIPVTPSTHGWWAKNFLPHHLRCTTTSESFSLSLPAIVLFTVRLLFLKAPFFVKTQGPCGRNLSR